MHLLLRKSARIREILKKIRMFEIILRRLNGLFLWVNHFRKGVVKNIDGITYELDLSELIDSSIYMYGCFEQELTDIIKKLVKPGFVVLDIGANIGCHTLLFSKLAGETGRVYAFEPTGNAFRKLKRNIELNKKFTTNIVLEKKAVSDKPMQNQPISFKNSWKRFGKDERICKEYVDLLTVDAYVKENGINRLDLIKIDVDGFEPMVLRGGENTIRNLSPVILLELNNTPEMEQTIESLLDMGYVMIMEGENKKMRSKEEVIDAVERKPLNNTGYKAANFIMVSEKKSSIIHNILA